MIVVKKSSKESQYLRNCGHFLGVDYFAFPHCIYSLRKFKMEANFLKKNCLLLIINYWFDLMFLSGALTAGWLTRCKEPLERSNNGNLTWFCIIQAYLYYHLIARLLSTVRLKKQFWKTEVRKLRVSWLKKQLELELFSSSIHLKNFLLIQKILPDLNSATKNTCILIPYTLTLHA